MRKTEKYNINKQIRSPKVRITGDDIESKIVDIKEALNIAHSKNLDLVEIVPNSNPPVCKIIDFKKFLYEKKLKEKEMEKSQRKNASKIKEIRLTYNTGEHDLNFKLKHAINFLEKGDKVKATIFFSGREITFKEQGELLLLKFVDELKEIGKPENLPKLENKKMWIIISPK
jgi:translation initiation factor IF-3